MRSKKMHIALFFALAAIAFSAPIGPSADDTIVPEMTFPADLTPAAVETTMKTVAPYKNENDQGLDKGSTGDHGGPPLDNGDLVWHPAHGAAPAAAAPQAKPTSKKATAKKAEAIAEKASPAMAAPSPAMAAAAPKKAAKKEESSSPKIKVAEAVAEMNSKELEREPEPAPATVSDGGEHNPAGHHHADPPGPEAEGAARAGSIPSPSPEAEGAARAGSIPSTSLYEEDPSEEKERLRMADQGERLGHVEQQVDGIEDRIRQFSEEPEPELEPFSRGGGFEGGAEAKRMAAAEAEDKVEGTEERERAKLEEEHHVAEAKRMAELEAEAGRLVREHEELVKIYTALGLMHEGPAKEAAKDKLHAKEESLLEIEDKLMVSFESMPGGPAKEAAEAKLNAMKKSLDEMYDQMFPEGGSEGGGDPEN